MPLLSLGTDAALPYITWKLLKFAPACGAQRGCMHARAPCGAGNLYRMLPTVTSSTWIGVNIVNPILQNLAYGIHAMCSFGTLMSKSSFCHIHVKEPFY